MAPHLERTDPAAGTPQGVGSTSFQPMATAAHFDLCSPCCSLVCRVAMAAQAMSMVTRFDSSFICRLGASVERLHHLARPSREEAMHRANSDVCTRHRMPCCICAAYSRKSAVDSGTGWSDQMDVHTGWLDLPLAHDRTSKKRAVTRVRWSKIRV